MNKKGITLIELLAVIVIVSVVALIIVPTVNKVVESSKETAFRASVSGILDSATTYLQKYLSHHEELPAVFLCNGERCGNGDDLLTIKGKVPISGKAVLSEDGALAEYITDGKLCAYGYKWNLIIGACKSIDQSAPIIDEDKASLVTVTSTTNSITVVMPEDLMTDEETLIEYTVTLYLDDGKVATKKYSGEDIVFTNLINNTEYKVVITGTNESKLKTTIEKTISTSDIVKPTIAYTNDPTSDVNGYFRSQTLNVSYTKGNIENPEYYIRSGRETSTNIDAIAICGTSTNPGNCTEITGTTIEADTWYKVSGSISVIYNLDADTESSLTALIHDGTNYVGSGSKAVGKIDNIAPTTPTGGAIGNVSGSNATGTIATVASGSTDTGVGGITYKYLVTNSNTAPDKNNVNFTTSRNFARSCGASYYGWAIAEDALGNRSEVKALGSTSDGANSYSGWTGCNKTCGGGTQTRTNTCALVTTGLSQSCNTHSCCSFTSQDFAYTGGMQAWAVPAGCSGTYTLEVWGAQGGSPGGDSNAPGGYGGYAAGYASLVEGQILYIGVGGAGSGKAGGFNGGGTSHVNSGGGGGATHIGTINATLAGTPPANVYIVAGGGGGGGYFSYVSNDHWVDAALPGGSGGGTNGSAGTGRTTAAGGGTQSGGYAYGQGGPGTDAGGAAAGGGGWYGGYGASSYDSGGGGGSGYIGGVSGVSMLNGQRAGHGYARITRR
nr:thrombospondin type-1 domain-containing protein [Bacilli bacterium]